MGAKDRWRPRHIKGLHNVDSKLLLVSAAACCVVGCMFPVVKSRTLSLVSFQRRSYRIGFASALALLFMATLDRSPSNLFLIIVCAATTGAIAYFRTSHIKTNGRIWAAYSELRRPDPPPALQEHRSEVCRGASSSTDARSVAVSVDGPTAARS